MFAAPFLVPRQGPLTAVLRLAPAAPSFSSSWPAGFARTSAAAWRAACAAGPRAGARGGGARAFATSAGAPSGSPPGGAAPAPPPASPGYTVTEVSLEPAARSRRSASALAVVGHVKGHTKKLSPVARHVAGRSVSEALVALALSPSRRAPYVARALNRAVNAARGPSGLPPAAFKVAAAWTGKHTAMPRVRHHSKGRAGRASKRTSKVWVRVAAMAPAEAARLNRYTVANTPASIARLDPRGY